MAESNPLQEAALDLAMRGLHVIPVWPPSASGLEGGCQCPRKSKCPSPGKHPVGDDWQNRATSNRQTIIHWWNERPDFNIGVKFGKDSGIIDIEFDSAEAKAAYARLVGTDAAPCPAFRAHRGPHFLHKWQPNLPDQPVIWAYEDGLTGWRIAKTGVNADPWAIEFRIGNGGGCQSVFPPSLHEKGATYEWLPGCTLEEIDPPNIPQVVVEMLANISQRRSEIGNGLRKTANEWKGVIQGVEKGGRNVAATQYLGKLLSMVGDNIFKDSQLPVLLSTFEMWNAGLPEPLPEAELNTIWASILKRARENYCNVPTAERHADWLATEKNGRNGKHEGTNGTHTVEAVPAKEAANDAAQPPEGWRMVIVKSNPRTFKLFSPFWEGPITLDKRGIRSWALITEAALEIDAVVPNDFRKTWLSKGTKKEGYFERLHSAAETEWARPELSGPLVLADYILDKIRGAQLLTKRDAPGGGWDGGDLERKIYRLSDGGGFVKVADLQNEWRRDNGSTIEKKQILECLQQFHAVSHCPKILGKQTNVWWIKSQGVQEMAAVIRAASIQATGFTHEENDDGGESD